MKKKIIESIMKTKKRVQWGRECDVFETDTFLVSYPKSGNTWLRFIVASLTFPKKNIDFNNIEFLIPDIYLHNNLKLLSFNSPRILKSHEYFDPRYKKVIYIVRDPRDVVISYWFHHKKKFLIPEDAAINDFFEEFMAGRLDPFGTWKENVQSWLCVKRNSPQFLLLRYEDLIDSPYEQISLISKHLEISTSENAIREVIQKTSFEKMQLLEKNQSNNWDPIKVTNKNIPFIRKGETYQWPQYLPKEQNIRIQKEWRDIMLELGYIL